jgi:hypothetical protein
VQRELVSGARGEVGEGSFVLCLVRQPVAPWLGVWGVELVCDVAGAFAEPAQ